MDGSGTVDRTVGRLSRRQGGRSKTKRATDREELVKKGMKKLRQNVRNDNHIFNSEPIQLFYFIWKFSRTNSRVPRICWIHTRDGAILKVVQQQIQALSIYKYNFFQNGLLLHVPVFQWSVKEALPDKWGEAEGKWTQKLLATLLASAPLCYLPETCWMLQRKKE